LPHARAVHTGNPVRADLIRPRPPRARPGLLVFGGSAGARRLNQAMLDALGRLGPTLAGLELTHQTGAADLETVRAGYAARGLAARVEPFIADMGAAYAAADLVVARAGATTCAELTAVGLPAILVPYPYAADDHQRRNAEVLVRAGAAEMILDAALDGERLATALRALLADAGRRATMAVRARALGRPDAAERVAEECLRLGAHDAANLSEDVDVLVISSAVTYANPEVSRARELKIPVIPRAEMLAELMRMKYGVAVAGSHGKTTTTSLTAAVLREAGRDPTMVVGGKLRALGTNARLGQGEFLVAEADESDGTFLLLSPIIAVVTNIDREHLDFPFRIAVHALEEFGGIHRRFEVKGEEQGVLVVDDYGHHPEEIRATLRAAREGFPRRLVVAFQPHRYTRTRDLFNEFLEAFDDADTLVLTDVYSAGEERIEGVSAEAVYHALRLRGHLD